MRGWPQWRYRIVLAVGAALFIYGVVVLVTAPPKSAHFHTDPTPGDLTTGSGVVLAGAGFVVFAYGWWLWSRDTLPPPDDES